MTEDATADMTDATGLPAEKLALLQRLVSKDNLQTRDGRGNQKIYYIDKDYVSEGLDAVFGAANWSRVTKEMKIVDTIEMPGTADRYEHGKKVEKPCTHFAITVMATVSVAITVGGRTIVREGTGVDTNNGPIGEGFAVTSKGDIIATAIKSAESDGFKRACNSLGYLFGRNIEKNGQSKVTVDGAEPAPRPVPAAAPARPATPAATKPATPAQPTQPAKVEPAKTAAAAPKPETPKPVEAPRPVEQPKAAEPAKTAEPAKPAEAAKTAEPAKPAAAKPADAKLRDRSLIPPAPGPNDAATVMQKHMQGLYNHSRYATKASELEDVIELLAAQRDVCMRISSYYTYYDYSIKKLTERAKDIAPELSERIAALEIPESQIPEAPKS